MKCWLLSEFQNLELSLIQKWTTVTWGVSRSKAPDVTLQFCSKNEHTSQMKFVQPKKKKSLPYKQQKQKCTEYTWRDVHVNTPNGSLPKIIGC